MSDTARSREMVGQAQLENDTVLEFWEEFEDQFVWDLLPASFLHALYVAWLRRDNPSGKPVSQRVLSSRLKEHLEASDSWEFMENAVRDRKSTRLNSSHVAISYAVFCVQKT